MGRRSETGGVEGHGDRIQFTIYVNGKRHRPTVDQVPTEANLRRARKRMENIQRRINQGTFVFAEEFPDYKFLERVDGASAKPLFDNIADLFLASFEGEYATRDTYRKILKRHWRPKFGKRPIDEISYGELAAHVGEHPWGSRKTRNNVVSVGRLVFGFAHADEAIERNPMDRIKTLKVQKPQPDPYTVEEAEALIAGALKDWGPDFSHYVELGFMQGPRPSEEIALLWPDADLRAGRLRIERARVMGRDKDSTKTHDARDVDLYPRSLDMLRRQATITPAMAGGPIFGPYHDLQVQLKRWDHMHKRLGIRRRVPYQMRHTSVTWNLLIGKPLLWVAKQHGHSPAVMLKTYAKWMEGTTDADIEAIRRAFWIDRVKIKEKAA